MNRCSALWGFVALWGCAAQAATDEWTARFEDAEAFLPARIAGLVDLPGRTSTLAAAAATDRVVSADGRYSAYAADHNLFVQDASGTRALTSDGELWRSFDARYADSNPQARPVRSRAAPLVQFLGASTWVVAERWDFRQVASVWLADSVSTARPGVTEQRRAFPGDRNIPLSELWLIDVASGKRRLIANDGWAYIGNMDVGAGGVFPAPDGRSVYYVRIDRQFRAVELCRVAVPDGEVEVVWREESEPYFTVRYPEIAFVGQGDEVVWKSDRDGRVHYYLIDTRGKRLVRQLSSGPISVERVLHVDARERVLFFEASGDGGTGDPHYVHGFRVGLDGRGQRRLDSEVASHTYVPEPSGRHFVDTFSTVDTPPRTVLRDRTGRIVKPLAATDAGRLREAGWRPPERYTVKAADGVTDLYGVMWKPFDFDPARRYPVVTSVYPGPSGDRVPVNFTPGHPNTALAQLGFIVIATETRGASSDRGKAFQTHARTFGNIRDYTLRDLRHVIETLARQRPWMDLQRVGIVGHSGGGFMTVAAMLHDPDFYRAGVASAGNHDNNIYEMNSGEFYWGDPRSGPAGGPGGYATNMEEVGRLRGALLLIHGESDSDVHVANTLRLVDALVHANKVFDLLLLPAKDHTVRYADPVANQYMRRRTWRHLLEHLRTVSAP